MVGGGGGGSDVISGLEKHSLRSQRWCWLTAVRRSSERKNEMKKCSRCSTCLRSLRCYMCKGPDVLNMQ